MTLLMAAAPAQAHTTLLNLYLLPDNHVRFENGPELDLAQLRLKIRNLKRRKPWPNIVLQPDKAAARYDFVAKVLATFQSEGYDRLGFLGLSQK
jgi:biopolymer transport protein ExbD